MSNLKTSFMRKLFLLVSAAAILSVSCNNNKTKGAVVVSDDGKTKVTITPETINNMKDASDAMTEKTEALKKLTPASLDEMKTMIPEEFMGMKRTSYNANSMMGASNATGKYKSDDGKELKLNIIDCAGEAGSGIYTLRYWTMWNFQNEDDNGYQKTVDFNGGKAIEKYSKYNDEYGLTFMVNDRYLVTVEGEKMGLDAVRAAAKSVKL
jgi:hypothetical protein